MPNKTWYAVKAAAAAGEPAYISIYDEIGMWGISASDFERDLRSLGKPKALDLHINSPGGDVFQGTAIYNMLARLGSQGTHITVYIDGVALSMGSLIAMVGDEIIMPSNSMMMLHNPAGGILGTSKDMREWAQVLDKLAEGMVTAYAKRSKLSREEVQAIMDAETWYTAQEAVDAGFATRIEDEVAIAARFDLSKFGNPPTGFGADGGGANATDNTEVDMTTKIETAAEMEARLRTEITASLTAEATAKADQEKKDAEAAAAAAAAPGDIAALIATALATALPAALEAHATKEAEAKALLLANGNKPQVQGNQQQLPNNHLNDGANDGDAPVVFKSLDSAGIMARWNGKKKAA